LKINIFWFRRDLRLDDNTALYHSFSDGIPVLTIFIFDKSITEDLPADDPRISFIHETLNAINNELSKHDSSLLVLKGDPETVWKKLILDYDINAVYVNKDYEPYSTSRDLNIEAVLRKHDIKLRRFKDQVIFEEKEIVKPDVNPYTIYTPYKNRWLRRLSEKQHEIITYEKPSGKKYFACRFPFPGLAELGFRKSQLKVRPFDLSVIGSYDKYRDYPAEDRTTYLGPHLRFGTVSIRKILMSASGKNATFLSELVWREFFMQILFNFPKVVTGNFRSKYDNVPWRNNEADFERWCRGETGFPLVDAGMRQLNETGYMHNRVRMITAGFLCKHLLIDWRWGEAYFAMKLLDFELSSNNGNWQWAAGTGCDAAQYFRVFNPTTQLLKFDNKRIYIKKWIKNLEKPDYPEPMVDHEFARKRVISAYKSGIGL
jgi:deoxyribodipyrimidine photo-lyase